MAPEYPLSANKPEQSDPSVNLNKLRWQCRRGIKEVEVILAPFFEDHFQSLSSELQQEFVALLECHDVDLFEWLTKRSYPEDGRFYTLLQSIFDSLGSATS